MINRYVLQMLTKTKYYFFLLCSILLLMADWLTRMVPKQQSFAKIKIIILYNVLSELLKNVNLFFTDGEGASSASENEDERPRRGKADQV